MRRTAQMGNLLRDLASGEGDLTRELPLAYVNCSQARGCGHQECVSFGKQEACWTHVGSMQPIHENIQCPSVLSGKIEDCSACEVFIAALHDEFDVVAAWINIFIGKVRYLIDRAKGVVTDISESSEQLAATATEQLAATVRAVAASVGHISSATTENTAAVDGVAHSAEIASSRAAELKEITDKFRT